MFDDAQLLVGVPFKKIKHILFAFEISTFLTVQEFSARPQCLWSAKFAKSFSANSWFQAIGKQAISSDHVFP